MNEPRNDPSAGCVVRKQTELDRVMQLAFPSRPRAVVGNKEGLIEEPMITIVTTYFDWKDRLRILISGWVRTEITHHSDVLVGRMRSASTVTVLRPGRRMR